MADQTRPLSKAVALHRAAPVEIRCSPYARSSFRRTDAANLERSLAVLKFSLLTCHSDPRTRTRRRPVTMGAHRWSPSGRTFCQKRGLAPSSCNCRCSSTLPSSSRTPRPESAVSYLGSSVTSSKPHSNEDPGARLSCVASCRSNTIDRRLMRRRLNSAAYGASG